MYYIGIVGSESKKFTPETEKLARETILTRLKYWMDEHEVTVVSGHCHLGGVDIYAEEAADALGLPKEIYPPKTYSWETGYKVRNLQIAKKSDIVYCITVKELPESYVGMRFNYCYHCRNAGWGSTNHVKSGGCYTMHQAIKLGKEGKLIIL